MDVPVVIGSMGYGVTLAVKLFYLVIIPLISVSLFSFFLFFILSSPVDEQSPIWIRLTKSPN